MIPAKSSTRFDAACRAYMARATPSSARARLASAVERAAYRITRHGVDRAFYGFSGGKDSIALRIVCREAGVEAAVFASCPLEFPAMVRWVRDHAPDVKHVVREDADLAMLARHPSRLFPSDGRGGYWWTSNVTHHGQNLFAKLHGFDTMIVGRRTADGNVCGRDGVARRADGLTTLSPIHDWTHEMVLDAVAAFGEVPPVYGWPRGWATGTSPWPGRRFPTVAAGWRETYAIDPDVVREAADVLPSARAFLDTV